MEGREGEEETEHTRGKEQRGGEHGRPGGEDGKRTSK